MSTINQSRPNARNLVKAARLLTCFLYLGAATLPASAKTILPAVGGPGDIQNAVVCPRGEYIVGFRGRIGDWIDRLGPICAPLLASGMMGKHDMKLPNQGGTGGSPIEVSCPSAGLVRQLLFYLTSDQRMVKTIMWHCYDPKTGQELPSNPPDRVWSFVGNGGSTAPQIKHSCKEGDAATGLQMNWGKYVNGIGLICDQVLIPVVKPPKQSPPQTCSDKCAPLLTNVHPPAEANRVYKNCVALCNDGDNATSTCPDGTTVKGTAPCK